MKAVLRFLLSCMSLSMVATAYADTPANNSLLGRLGPLAVVSPYVGLRSAFDGSDLLVNLPSIDQDVRLIEQRAKIDSMFEKRGGAAPDFPLLDISGTIQGNLFLTDPYHGAVDGDIDLSAAEIDFVTYISRSVTGLIAITYDNAPSDQFTSRTSNSRLFLDKGFITIGRLQDDPVYLTIGQLYVPFGRYSSEMLSSPAPLLIGRYKGRTVLLGYSELDDNRWFGSVYVFDGDIHASSRIEGGGRLGLRMKQGDWSVEGAVSVISNMANADHSQLTGGSAFAGFATNSTTATLQKRVPGADAYLIVKYGAQKFIAEYVTATERFNALDLTFNGSGATPWGLQLETNRTFDVMDHPATLALAYNRTGEAFALNVPEHRILAYAAISIWRNTVLSAEYRHDINYRQGTTGSGSGNVISGIDLGKTADSATLKFSAYF